ncbi:hypothetical protein LWI28_002975 [Acer negundo]|uniref:HMG box domain-containing protein n=1 Tax=Acer negundo TaxID=4023 RepID=A0AAD5ILJ4_ACENE|nr:hypothetical protein LWI28_002975 [Acer negundo]
MDDLDGIDDEASWWRRTRYCCCYDKSLTNGLTIANEALQWRSRQSQGKLCGGEFSEVGDALRWGSFVVDFGKGLVSGWTVIVQRQIQFFFRLQSGWVVEMAGGRSSKSNAPKARKRVEAESASSDAPSATLLRAKNGSAFTKCEECNKDVPVVLISMHNCSLDAKIKMNLEAQVVEKPAEVKKKPERKKPASSEPRAKRLKKKGSGSNKPKRPPTAFFIFMDDFRKEFKAANPDSKGVTEVTKQGGERWKSLTDEEKKPYVDKAAELKAEYAKALEGNDAENEDEGEAGSEKDSDEKEVEEEEAQEAEATEEEAKEEEEVLDDY